MNETWRQHPIHGLNLEIAEVFLRRAWCRATTDPQCRESWSDKNPAKGQSDATTAFLYTDLQEDGFESEILTGKVEGYGYHYWLRLPDGTEVDMTRHQFPENCQISDVSTSTIEELLHSESAKQRRVSERMNLLLVTCQTAFDVWFEAGLERELLSVKKRYC